MPSIDYVEYASRRARLGVPDTVFVSLQQHRRLAERFAELEKRLSDLEQRPKIVQVAAPEVQMEREPLSQNGTLISCEAIQSAVCRLFRLTKNELTGQSRSTRAIRPRHIAMWFCSRHLPMSAVAIGHHFGGRDHTTVLHAVKRIDEFFSRDDKLVRQVEQLENALGITYGKQTAS